MATTIEQLVNQALRRTSYKIEIGYIYEGSQAARMALTLYGQTRDELLRSQDWPFARRVAPLTLLKTAPVGGYGPTGWTDAYPQAPWIYEYAYPDTCLELRSVRPTPIIIPEYDPQPNVFTEANDLTVSPTKVVLTNLRNALAVFTGQINDPSQWEPTFTEALVEGLSRRLAEGLGANTDSVKTQFQIAQAAEAKADRIRG